MCRPLDLGSPGRRAVLSITSGKGRRDTDVDPARYGRVNQVVHPGSTGPAALGRGQGHRLTSAVGALVALDAIGGLIAIADGINERRDAWGSAARLAAPWPMILAQAGLTALAVRSPRSSAVGASALLSLACL